MPHYIVESTSERDCKYWTGRSVRPGAGWTRFRSMAKEFSQAERDDPANLPFGGRWVPVGDIEAEGSPVVEGAQIETAHPWSLYNSYEYTNPSILPDQIRDANDRTIAWLPVYATMDERRLMVAAPALYAALLTAQTRYHIFPDLLPADEREEIDAAIALIPAATKAVPPFESPALPLERFGGRVQWYVLLAVCLGGQPNIALCDEHAEQRMETLGPAISGGDPNLCDDCEEARLKAAATKEKAEG